MEYLSIFLWFLSGVIFHKAMSSLLELGILSRAVEKTTKDLMFSLVFIEQDIQFVIESKKLMLKEKGLSDDEIERISYLQERTFKLWREKVIITFINNYPEFYKERFLPFKNWDGAALYVNQLINEQKNLQSKNR